MKINFKSEEDLANYINRVLVETSKINDEIRVEIILKKLAKEYNIGYNTLEKRFKDLKNFKPASKIEIKATHKKAAISIKSLFNFVFFPVRETVLNSLFITIFSLLYIILNLCPDMIHELLRCCATPIIISCIIGYFLKHVIIKNLA